MRSHCLLIEAHVEAWVVGWGHFMTLLGMGIDRSSQDLQLKLVYGRCTEKASYRSALPHVGFLGSLSRLVSRGAVRRNHYSKAGRGRGVVIPLSGAEFSAR